MNLTYLQQRQQLKLNGPVAKEKKVYKISFRSKKGAKEHREYVAIVKEMLEESNKCEMNLIGCTIIAEGLHHQKKRAGNMLNKEHLLRACNSCNLRAETHPLEAIEKGVSLSKFS